jgi:hypothetical protein
VREVRRSSSLAFSALRRETEDGKGALYYQGTCVCGFMSESAFIFVEISS